MTATQPDSEGYTRRGVMRKTAIGLGATAGVGAGASRIGASPVGSASAIAPALIVGGGFAAGVAVDYALRNVDNPFTGDSNTDYNEANADAVEAQIRQNALNVSQADTAVLTNIENLLSSSENYVVAEAKKAAIDELNAGNSIQSAKDAAQTVVDDFYTTQQQNLISHFEAQISKVRGWFSQINNTDGLSIENTFSFERDNSSGGAEDPVGGTGEVTRSITLTDGTDRSYEAQELGISSDLSVTGTLDVDSSSCDLYVSDGSGGFSLAREGDRFSNLMSSIIDTHSSVLTNMEALIDGFGPSYQAGDISSEDIISPNDLIGDEAAQDDYSQAGAQLAAMGLQSSKFAMEIELVETGETVEGSIYHSDDSIDSLQKDVQYDPESDIQGTVYLAYNVTDDGGSGGETNTTNSTTTGGTTTGGGELIGLKEPFIIRSITDGNGNQYNAANYESKNQQTYTAEVEKIEEELKQVRQLREDLEEQRTAAATNDEPAGGAGAGFFGDGGPSTGAIAVVVGGIGVVYALFGQENN